MVFEMRSRHSFHPLLLEPAYWRNRLQGLDLTQRYPTITPRPDLSHAGATVCEFRLRGHDGQVLWGTFSHPHWGPGPWPTRIRLVGPCERPVADSNSIQQGCAELVYQQTPGRALRDRVLDAIRISQLALDTRGVDPRAVEYSCLKERRFPDEFRIAEQLMDSNFIRKVL